MMMIITLQVSSCRLQLGKEELPEFFEADERSCNGAEDILHLVSGRSLLGTVRLRPIAALPAKTKLNNVSLNGETVKKCAISASEAHSGQLRNMSTPDTARFQGHHHSSDDQDHKESVTSDSEKGNETMEDKRKYNESASTSLMLLEMRIDDSIVGFGLQRSTISGKQETLFLDRDGVVFAQEQDGKIVKVNISILISIKFTVFSSGTTWVSVWEQID